MCRICHLGSFACQVTHLLDKERVNPVSRSPMKLPNIFTDSSKIRSFEAGETIFKAGDPGTEMFIVHEGEVDITIHGKVVETVNEDHFFGELALIDEAPRSADAVARTACKLVPLNQREFTFLVDEIPFFALRVMKVLADRLRRADKSGL